MLKEPRPSADFYARLAQVLQRGAASPAGEDHRAEPEAASPGAVDEREGPPRPSQRRTSEAAGHLSPGWGLAYGTDGLWHQGY